MVIFTLKFYNFWIQIFTKDKKLSKKTIVGFAKTFDTRRYTNSGIGYRILSFPVEYL